MVQEITVQNKMQALLERELERLKRILALGYELKAKRIPNGNSKLSGEVKRKEPSEP
jgi:hypothetical protein